MNVTRDRIEEVFTINQRDYTEELVERFGTKGCSPAYTPGLGWEPSLNQPEETMLAEEDK